MPGGIHSARDGGTMWVPRSTVSWITPVVEIRHLRPRVAVRHHLRVGPQLAPAWRAPGWAWAQTGAASVESNICHRARGVALVCRAGEGRWRLLQGLACLR